MAEEHVDVLVVGAGISGIDAAYHLKTMCPDRSFVILEGRDDLGGTWDLFRYPGVRSDSDMHTLGFGFKPWTGAKAIADGPSIMEYLRETVAEYRIDEHIRFGHLVVAASWSSDGARWTVEADRGGERVTLTCNFLFMCSGYYSYRRGYTPDFEGRDRFRGQIVHPQEWPDDFDHAGTRIVVIGSGATAVTLVPALAADAEHVTMLQRSPTYMVSRPARDPIADVLRRLLPSRWAYRLTRAKNSALQEWMYKRIRKDPAKAKEKLLKLVRDQLGAAEVEEHFTPTYDPWDQRLCLVPDNDFFDAIKAGTASVVNGEVDTFTENGIRLESGDELDADVIVTATGLNLVTVGDMAVTVDGEPVDFSRTWTYKGVAYSDVPNMASSFGYIAASWTLRADLTCEWVCRLLNHMADVGADQCTPRLRPSDRDMPERPFIRHFTSGYMQRMMPMLPKQGDRPPWLNPQIHSADKQALRKDPFDDGVMQFTDARDRTPSEIPV